MFSEEDVVKLLHDNVKLLVDLVDHSRVNCEDPSVNASRQSLIRELISVCYDCLCVYYGDI